MKQQLLLLEDVDGLGRQGDVVTAKPGFVRNFLLPQKKAVRADKGTLQMQTRLKLEREKKAIIDRKEAEELALQLKSVELTHLVKVDQNGKMYGSVTAMDIARLLQLQGYNLTKQNIVLPHALKAIGKHTLNLRLKEGVPATIALVIVAEGAPIPRVEAAAPAEAAPSEE